MLFFEIVAGFCFSFTAITSVAFVLRYVLQGNLKAGIFIAIGNWTVQVLYIVAAIYFLKLLGHFKYDPHNHFLWQWLPGVIFLLLGVAVYRIKPRTEQDLPKGITALKAYCMGVILTTFGIGRILGYMAFVAIFNRHIVQVNWANQIELLISLLLGVALYWLVFIVICRRFSKYMTAHRLALINKSIGIILILLGLFTFFD